MNFLQLSVYRNLSLSLKKGHLLSSLATPYRPTTSLNHPLHGENLDDKPLRLDIFFLIRDVPNPSHPTASFTHPPRIMVSLFTDGSRDFRLRLVEVNRAGVSSSSDITSPQFCPTVVISKTLTKKPAVVNNFYKTRCVFDKYSYYFVVL